METDPHHAHPESRPGDFIGRDHEGRVKIDRVIPLPWLIGILGMVAANAAAVYYGQQQLVEKFSELKIDVRALAGTAAHLNGRDIEHTLRIQSIERRLDTLEARK